MPDSATKLETAAAEANDIVIALSMAIMDTESTDSTRAQARAFQPVFGGIRDVLGEAHRGYYRQAHDDWERLDSSRAALNLADAVLAIKTGGRS